MRHVIAAAGLCFALAAPLASGASAATVRATVGTGVLVGEADAKVATFKGVPYAAPPVGPLRWKAAAPAKPWIGERKAADFGPSCMQPPPPANVPDDSAAYRTSEDCLYLNVWAPVDRTAKHPVMVWIHGGGNRAGTASDAYYDGRGFARDGVVLVSINYRLGPFGFFAHPALTAEAGSEPAANFGLTDQLAALAWVKRNIAAFGGDPADVTVFGESAGGQDVAVLLTAPSAKGLFAKAIMESAGRWTNRPSLAAAEAEGTKFATAAGLATATATAAQLRALSADKVMSLGEPFEAQPVVDGKVLPEQPAAAFAAGRAIDVPLIIGTNGNEGSLIGNQARDPEQLSPAADRPALERLRTAYGDKARDGPAFGRLVFRDLYFSAPSRWLAAREGARAPAYLYRFDYVLSLMRARRDGAGHASEIPYVFDTWPTARISSRDEGVTAAMHGCWIAFAKTGTPACPNAPAWPAYTPATDQWMHFAADGTVAPAPVEEPRILDALALRETAAR